MKDYLLYHTIGIGVLPVRKVQSEESGTVNQLLPDKECRSVSDHDVNVTVRSKNTVTDIIGVTYIWGGYTDNRVGCCGFFTEIRHTIQNSAFQGHNNTFSIRYLSAGSQ